MQLQEILHKLKFCGFSIHFEILSRSHNCFLIRQGQKIKQALPASIKTTYLKKKHNADNTITSLRHTSKVNAFPKHITCLKTSRKYDILLPRSQLNNQSQHFSNFKPPAEQMEPTRNSPLGPQVERSWALEIKCQRSLCCETRATTSGDCVVPWKAGIVPSRHDDLPWKPDGKNKFSTSYFTSKKFNIFPWTPSLRDF